MIIPIADKSLNCKFTPPSVLTLRKFLPFFKIQLSLIFDLSQSADIKNAILFLGITP